MAILRDGSAEFSTALLELHDHRVDREHVARLGVDPRDRAHRVRPGACSPSSSPRPRRAASPALDLLARLDLDRDDQARHRAAELFRRSPPAFFAGISASQLGDPRRHHLRRQVDAAPASGARRPDRGRTCTVMSSAGDGRPTRAPRPAASPIRRHRLAMPGRTTESASDRTASRQRGDGSGHRRRRRPVARPIPSRARLSVAGARAGRAAARAGRARSRARRRRAAPAPRSPARRRRSRRKFLGDEAGREPPFLPARMGHQRREEGLVVGDAVDRRTCRARPPSPRRRAPGRARG